MSLRTPVKTLNLKLLEQVKEGFVPMPGGQTEPVAGASQMTAAMGSPMGGGGAPPMDPSMMGGAGAPPMDPSMMGGGMPMDPSMMGGAGAPPPMDPSMMGGAGAPPPPADPAAAGGLPPEMAGMQAGPDGMVTMPVSQLITLIGVLKGGGGDKPEGGAAAPAEAKPKKPSSQQLLSEIHAAVTGQPAQAPAPSPSSSSSGGASSGSSENKA